jgi:hypothetical protein
MNKELLWNWAEKFACETRLLSAEEIGPILYKAGAELLMAAIYEPIHESTCQIDRGIVYDDNTTAQGTMSNGNI